VHVSPLPFLLESPAGPKSDLYNGTMELNENRASLQQ
jgi:hypothetical protein